jgi:hypothetical protein
MKDIFADDSPNLRQIRISTLGHLKEEHHSTYFDSVGVNVTPKN